MTARDLVLGGLINFSEPVSQLADAIKDFDWDFDGKPLTMEREHIKRVLLRYIRGELTAQDVEGWANLVEGREDIDFESDHEDLIGECVNELANPALTHDLSVRRATDLVRLIERG